MKPDAADSSSPPVVVIGSYLVALVIEVERFPAVGETVHGHGYFETHGGKGSNMAVQAARLGARTSFVGRVGDDARGRAFVDLLAAEGVAAEHVHLQADTATGVGFILLGNDGQNMIAIDSGANAHFSAADVERAGDLMQPPATVLTQLEIPAGDRPACHAGGPCGGLHHHPQSRPRPRTCRRRICSAWR